VGTISEPPVGTISEPPVGTISEPPVGTISEPVRTRGSSRPQRRKTGFAPVRDYRGDLQPPAASTTLASNIARVIGPTPPGMGAR
jgi:hypothetical protein